MAFDRLAKAAAHCNIMPLIKILNKQLEAKTLSAIWFAGLAAIGVFILPMLHGLLLSWFPQARILEATPALMLIL